LNPDPTNPTQTIRAFHRRGGELHAEEVALGRIAERFGTPCYVYSAGSLRERYRRLRSAFVEAFAPLEPIVAFSVKACPSLGVLGLLAKEGAAFDVVSGGELLRVARAGGDPRSVIFAGVGKTNEELELALEADVFQINLESEGELARLDAIAERRGARARAALRVNPELDPKTHRHLATGAKHSKFGIPLEEAARVLADARRFASVEIVGLHVHLGSMLRDPQLYADALDRLDPLVRAFPNHRPSTLDIGGGLAIPVGDEPELEPRRLAEALAPRVRAIGAQPILEPGRWIAAPSGALLATVLDRKRSGGHTILVTDAGMNDLIRPALYDAVHPVESLVSRGESQGSEIVDVVGPVCESGDVLAKRARIPTLSAGDRIAILDAGAYGFSMASNYNSRPRAAEVLVDGSEARLIRRRESFDDLLRGEST
jgi:diaminopimelate decarboxylase